MKLTREQFDALEEFIRAKIAFAMAEVKWPNDFNLSERDRENDARVVAMNALVENGE